MIFRFKRKEKNRCLHDWRLTDYKTYVDFSLDVVEYYEIICLKCRNTKSVSKYRYEKMKRLGLIKGEIPS